MTTLTEGGFMNDDGTDSAMAGITGSAHVDAQVPTRQSCAGQEARRTIEPIPINRVPTSIIEAACAASGVVRSEGSVPNLACGTVAVASTNGAESSTSPISEASEPATGSATAMTKAASTIALLRV